ncbi:SKP1/ASK-interacting protein 16 [Wolffia australiana]
MAATLELLEGLVLESIFSFLDPKNVAAIACVSRRLRSFAGDDALWRAVCSSDLDLSSPLNPDGEPCSSFKIAYAKWRESFAGYPWPLVVRIKRAWSDLKAWMSDNFPELRETLQKGASEAEIEDAERKLGVKLPLPSRILIRFVNGQNTVRADISGHDRVSLLGAIGGYCFYDHLVNVHLYPLDTIVSETIRHRRQLGYSTRSKRVIVADSTYSEKTFFLNCADGQLLVESKNGEMLPCVPRALIRLSPGDCGDGTLQDALLLWLEEHGRRLRSGMIGVREFYRRKMICLFPETPPSCSIAITHGVKVRASSIFVPEMSDLGDEGDDKYWFAYSIRLSLSSEGCILDGMRHSSCQLSSRHWIIRALENVVSDVRGEAVIGKFPLLLPGGEEFVYESCASLPKTPGSIEGSFTFVPGRLTGPQGQPFDVEVARFSLETPSYIF